MIIRIMSEGQWRFDDAAVDRLNELDAKVEAAIDSGDEATFSAALTALLDAVRTDGVPVPVEELIDSDLVLPPGDATIDDVQHLLGDEGLIPG